VSTVFRRAARAPALALTITAAAFGASSIRAQETPAPGAPPTKLTHEQLWLLKRVSAPQPSPDGRWVAFIVNEPAYAEKDRVADIWLAPLDRSAPPRRITNTPAPEADLAWSPDSRRLAFVARRAGDDVRQVYVLNLAGGGEARAVTRMPTAARSPVFSPDGRRIAFVADAERGVRTVEESAEREKARKARPYEARVYEGFPIRNWDEWRTGRVPHLYVQELSAESEPAGPTRDLLGGTRLESSAGFAGRTTNDEDALDPVFTPDGRAIVFVASAIRDRAAFDFTDEQLWRVDVAGGEPERITTGRDSWSRPRFAPDGRTLFALREPHTGRVYNASRVAALAWPAGGASRDVSASLDRPAEQFAVSTDGRTIYFTAEDAGLQRIYAVPAAGGASRVVSALEEGVYGGLAIPARADRTRIVATWDSATSPAEIVLIEPSRAAGASAHEPLTSFNAGAATALGLPPVRHVVTRDARGEPMHSLLVVPRGFDERRKYPLFVLIHGGPHTMWRDTFFLRWNYHLIAEPGYVLLLTNYRGSTGFGEAFARRIQGDPLEGPANDINEAADAAIAQFPFIDGERQCAGGASYGGHLANWLQASTTRYRCLVSHAGLVNLESQWATSDIIYSREVNLGGPPWAGDAAWREQNPMRRAASFRTPVLVTIGERDYRVPLNNTLEYWSALQRQQVPSRLVVFPTENHWILDGENSRYFYGELHAWLAKWLGPGER
jgi:dipeptidyl aminopeptidase/acylaminoacyl peptidase